MAPYIYEEKNGIHILDVVQTIDELEKARAAFKSAKNVIFENQKEISKISKLKIFVSLDNLFSLKNIVFTPI